MDIKKSHTRSLFNNILAKISNRIIKEPILDYFREKSKMEIRKRYRPNVAAIILSSNYPHGSVNGF